MTREEAICALCDGHTIWKPEFAEKVCKTVGVKFNKKRLVYRFQSDQSPSNPKGLQMNEGQENAEGVNSLTLSYYVASELGVEKKAEQKLGRGFQAQAYAKVISEALKSASA